MRILLILVHGIGDYTKQEVNQRGAHFVRAIVKKNPGLKNKIEMKAVRYSDILQARQEAVWHQMLETSENFGQQDFSLRGLFRRIWVPARRFLLFNFSDAAVLGHMAHLPNSVYNLTMARIEDEIRDGWSRIPEDEQENTAVVLMGDSLGAHLMSNYIWDMQSKSLKMHDRDADSKAKLPADYEQVSLQAMRLFVSTGCNIPIFVSGMEHIQAIYNDRWGYNFKWLNIYDHDDLLGWPLNPLGDYHDPERRGLSYADIVEDRQINAHGGLRGYFLQSWNPFSHWQYWETGEVEALLAKMIGEIARDG